MTSYAQTNGTTVTFTTLNNAMDEESAPVRSAHAAKYRHLWRFGAHFTNCGSTLDTIEQRRYFYAPDDMLLVGAFMSGRFGTTASTVSLKFAGDTEMLGSDLPHYYKSASFLNLPNTVQVPIAETFIDRGKKQFFVRKGGLYYVEVDSPSAGVTAISPTVQLIFCIEAREE